MPESFIKYLLAYVRIVMLLLPLLADMIGLLSLVIRWVLTDETGQGQGAARPQRAAH